MLWLWLDSTLDYRGRKHCRYRCTVRSGISLFEHPDNNLWWTKGFPQYSTCSISMRTSVFSAGVNHRLWVTCVALPLQADQAWLSIGRKSWFINGQTQMEPSSCHIWPLVSNRAKDFLLPWVEWVVVSLSLCCAYRHRWYVFQICTGIFSFWMWCDKACWCMMRLAKWAEVLQA